MDQSLSNYIKYCLGYVKITRAGTIAAQQKHSVELSTEHFDLSGLLDGAADNKIGETINFSIFYEFDPVSVPEDKKEQYNKEKQLATKVNEIYSKYKNDQFTKQIILNFGFFEVELPVQPEEVNSNIDSDEEVEANEVKTRVDRYPLFTMPVNIETENSNGLIKYTLYAVDPDIQVNIGMLEPILGEDSYFQLLEEMGEYEVKGQLSLPILGLEVFSEVWHKIKAQLKLKDANFTEQSFSLEDVKLALSPKANYFLAEDLAKLAKLSEEDLVDTSLESWVNDDDLNTEVSVPAEKELYFPFLYDKYQLSALTILGNKASIIQGPPGTGKSETIANILCHLAANGKKVLFVSQKAQALKVVKDKLKNLDIDYLYGYLPNPSSSQIGEEDEADGIAPQLSALSSHIEKINRQQKRESIKIENIVERKKVLSNDFESVVNTQREYYQLHEEFLSLKKFSIDITNYEIFRKGFNSDSWSRIKDLRKEIELLDKKIKKYRQVNDTANLDKIFSSLDLVKSNFSEVIKKIRDDVERTGYDRHSRIVRKLNNINRNLRLSKLRSGLPREIIDFIDNILYSDVSRQDAVRDMTVLCDYCIYYENIGSLHKNEKDLEKNLKLSGVSDSEFDLIDGLLDSASAKELESIKGKILRVQEIKKKLKDLQKTKSLNSISSSLKKIQLDRKKEVASYIQNIINKNLSGKWNKGVTVRQIVRKLASAFGKSKKAFKTFDKLRKDSNNFNAILDLIPVWIMELDDASRIVPLEAAIFDYVILDEASQCNVAYTLPVMYRANHVLFVGDSEQMRDTTIMFKSNRIFDELARRYNVPEERQIKATGTAVQSVLDIAYKRGFLDRPLRYHYRSPAELIGFSNKYFYAPKGKELIPINSSYVAFEDTSRIMLVHEVKSTWDEEFSDRINVAEAKSILELFKKMKNDVQYSNKSFGILTFFNAQATFIRELFEKEGFKEEDDNYKVSIVEGIQGDEKDIIIYSMVIRSVDQKKKYVPLTGEGGDIQADINRGRVNVAFSRARLQVHCFISMPSEELPEKIWIKKYVDYAINNGKVKFTSSDLNPFDSNFEKEFYEFLHKTLSDNYKIQNQVPSCGFKIDFVVSDIKSGNRLAIECDGPCHFENEIDETYGIYVESDEERQNVLESAGWHFCRVKYSDWIDPKFERKNITDTIIELLR